MQTEQETLDVVSQMYSCSYTEDKSQDGNKYWQLITTDKEQYESIRAYLLLFNLNVGEAVFQPLTELWLFRVYPEDKDVDFKNDTKY